MNCLRLTKIHQDSHHRIQNYSTVILQDYYLETREENSNIQVGVAFLCTRVKLHMEQDCRKFGRVISYLKETIHLPLVVGIDNNETLTWNIDASFTVHSD